MTVDKGLQQEKTCLEQESVTICNEKLVEALSELYDLLEQYAPSWYTQEHHKKALSALQLAKKS